jgi:hypothetical protein
VIDKYDPSSEQGKKLENFFRSLDNEISLDKSNRNLGDEERQGLEDINNPNEENNEENDENVDNAEESERDEIVKLWNDLY